LLQITAIACRADEAQYLATKGSEVTKLVNHHQVNTAIKHKRTNKKSRKIWSALPELMKRNTWRPN